MSIKFSGSVSHVFATSALVAALVAPGVPALAATQAAATATVTVKGGWTDPQMAHLARQSGQLLVRRIRAAEGMIVSGQYRAARNELDAAEDTAGAIRSMMPFLTVADNIRNAKNKLVAEDVTHFRDDLLPIYSQLDEMSAYAPDVAQDAKNKLKQAETDAAGGNTAKAGKDMQDAEETITTSTLYMPIDYVYGRVAAARMALSRPTPNIATAQRALKNADDHLVADITTVEVRPIG